MPTVKQYIDAITASHGLISKAADRLGCSRKAIYDARDRHPKVREALLAARERTTDLAESKLFENIDKNDNTAIIFYLKTQAKHRGYVERQEIVSDGKLKIEVEYIDDDTPTTAEAAPLAD